MFKIARRKSIEKRLAKRLKQGPLLTLRLDVINKCNLRCVMCHYSDPAIARRPARSLTAEEFSRYFAEVSPYVRDVMLSCGDEPLMSRHFVEILEVIAADPTSRDMGFCTNAMLMDARIRDAMIEHGVTYVLLSMDGVTRETLERIRVGSKYERIVGRIKALRDLKRQVGSPYPAMVMDYVMLRSNLKEAPAFVSLGHELGVELLDFRHAVSSEYWDDEEEKLQNHQGVFNGYRRRIVEEADRLGIRIVIPDPYPGVEPVDCRHEETGSDLAEFHAVEPDRASESPPAPRRFPESFEPRAVLDHENEFYGTGYCERPFSEVFIRNQSEVLPCAWHRTVLGRLEEGSSISDIFWGSGFRALRAKMLNGEIDPGCANCPVKQDLLPTRAGNTD